MDAGRELDKLVAEKVMGFLGVGYYGPTKSNGGHLDQEKFDTWEEALEAYRKFWPKATVKDHVENRDEEFHLSRWKEGWGTLNLDHYSTDITAAISALEHHGWNWAITFSVSGGYRVDVWDPEEPWSIDHHHVGHSYTLAHAICIALVRASDAVNASR